jgi:hypothetical protein
VPHTGVWPSYQHTRVRQVAALDPDGTCYDSKGTILGKGLDYAGLANLALAERADIYVDSLTAEQWIDLVLDAVEDARACVRCSRSGGIVSIQFTGAARRTGSICSMANWASPDTGGVVQSDRRRALASIETVSRIMGVGTYVSPGALGEAHWRAARRDCAPVSVPCLAARTTLLSHIVGGRADTPALGESFAEAYESDMRSAYPSLSVGVPVGTAGRMLEEPHEDEAVTYFAHCTVVVPGHCRGVSPVSLSATDDPHSGGGLRRQRRVFRAVPGSHTCWLWREEVDAARESGFIVAVGAGWYWTRLDTDNRAWLARLAECRRVATAAGVVGLVKRAGVAAIGRHGMGDTTWELVNEAHADPAVDQPVIAPWGDAPILALWLHPTAGPVSHRLPHWYSYILAKCRLALWRRYTAEERAGNRPLLTNFDGILTAGYPTEPVSDEDIPGTWKASVLHDVEIVAPRSYRSRERTVLPGVRR